MFGRKVAHLMEWCAKVACPIIGINDSGGARIQDAVTSLAWYAELGARHERLTGLVPQISLIFGKCAGGAVYSPIQDDLIVAVRDQGYMFVTGPDVIKEVTGEDVTLDELGGAEAQAATATSTRSSTRKPQRFNTCASSCRSCRRTASTTRRSSIPVWSRRSRRTTSSWIRSCRTATTRSTTCTRSCCGSSTTGISSTSARRPGKPSSPGSPRRRATGRRGRQPADGVVRVDRQRSLRQGGAVHPILRHHEPAADLRGRHPGFLPGAEQEKRGIIKRGGRFLYAVVEADVPKVTITVRKSYGGAYAVMGSKQLTADLNFAWPTARIAVIGAEGAAQLLMKRFPDPTTPEAQAIKQSFIENYNLNMATPWIAAERGFIDAVIEPHQTRLLLRKALHLLRDKQVQHVQRKHALIPI
ncbi:carboxyl transferase domain protein [Mycobacterium xenopi 3993]|nr:carboxyl transferase domain protein [Mycobacterium xenopi 3993]